MDKKGSAMIEATLVLPIIIFSIMAIIAILMFLFEEAAAQAALHQVIRTESGKKTGTFQGLPGSSSIVVNTEFKGIHRVMIGTSSVIFEGAWMIPRSVQKPLMGYEHLTDERQYARYVDFFTMEDNKDEEQNEKSFQ